MKYKIICKQNDTLIRFDENFLDFELAAPRKVPEIAGFWKCRDDGQISMRQCDTILQSTIICIKIGDHYEEM